MDNGPRGDKPQVDHEDGTPGVLAENEKAVDDVDVTPIGWRIGSLRRMYMTTSVKQAQAVQSMKVKRRGSRIWAKDMTNLSCPVSSGELGGAGAHSSVTLAHEVVITLCGRPGRHQREPERPDGSGSFWRLGCARRRDPRPREG